MRKFFERLRKYDLKLNPAKRDFRVPSGKLLGFIVSRRGIELDPTKIKAIRDLPPPRTKKDVMSLLGRLNYISRFIGQLTTTCETIFKLLKKDAAIKWTSECQEAFDKIKEYLSNPPVLVPLESGRPLFLYIPRFHDELADELATLASMLPYPGNAHIDPLEIQIRERDGYCNAIEARPNVQPWYHDIKRFLKTQEYPEYAIGDQKRAIRRHASGFFLSGEVLYKRTPHLNLLRCVDAEKARRIMQEVHAGVCGPHMNGQCCEPEESFDGGSMRTVQITHRNSTPYLPKANGVVEAANKNIKKILRKTIQSSRQWHEQLPFALLGYRTTVRTSVGATPYLLVYGTEAVIPAEVEIPSLRTIVEAEIKDSEWVKTQLEQLTLIDEKRIGAEAKGKFAPNWKGSYIIRKILPRGALYLGDIEGNDPEAAVNADAVKSSSCCVILAATETKKNNAATTNGAAATATIDSMFVPEETGRGAAHVDSNGESCRETTTLGNWTRRETITNRNAAAVVEMGSSGAMRKQLRRAKVVEEETVIVAAWRKQVVCSPLVLATVVGARDYGRDGWGSMTRNAAMAARETVVVHGCRA
ncbi:uncharacterized protein LOC142176029 [Nicotiana tabacum]|uniref:Uncharacterized protein LOC142176029 n=1 Tax=Nicotiana tabacum TaxID=4097 RepID=A0AC58TPN2_TOBAC